MSALTFDPLGRREVILAPERARRGAPSIEPTPPDPAPCDFCGGREDRTPPETFAVRPDGGPDTPGWSVRVVPNLYAATPFHEVVVHTPDHLERFEDTDHAHRTDVLRTYAHRIEAAPTPAVIVVWNRGRASGASRTHAHGQLFGLEAIPPTLGREVDAFAGDGCVLCGLADDDDLLVAQVGGCRVLAHPVPLVAHELLIVPPHDARYEDASLDGPADAFADALVRTLGLLGDGVPCNLVVHTAPRGVDRFHWHAHLMPRTAVWGGLEMGAELPIVAADPAASAAALRAVPGPDTR